MEAEAHDEFVPLDARSPGDVTRRPLDGRGGADACRRSLGIGPVGPSRTACPNAAHRCENGLADSGRSHQPVRSARIELTRISSKRQRIGSTVTHDPHTPKAAGLAGKALREQVPRGSHRGWSPGPDRPDPIGLITEQNRGRLQFLVPIRHWRMAQSPFAFYRGSATVMAADLSTTPVTGLGVQLCGDAHLSNFGVYGSPERSLVFDINDFDETLPGPWEWDVKRLATSFSIAARHNEYGDDEEFDLPRRVARAYREAMRRFATAPLLDVWYAHLDVEEVFRSFSDRLTKQERKRRTKFVTKARAKNSLQAAAKLTERTDDGARIVSQPPLLIPLRDIPGAEDPDVISAEILRSFRDYLESVPDHLKLLVKRFRYRDMAIKVVGVGSVGTRCLIVLLEGRDDRDPFSLQIKEARRSVLEDHLPATAYAEHGRRVVEGQRLMQAASDSFLGWTVGGSGTHYYWRQFTDMKASIEVEGAPADTLKRYADLCGWTLARAHARSGDPAAIAGYLGKGTGFDRAMARFSIAYADQNERDYQAFTAAIADGRLPAHE
jgi:uncharacterized protein (DUF2252 family)